MLSVLPCLKACNMKVYTGSCVSVLDACHLHFFNVTRENDDKNPNSAPYIGFLFPDITLL